MKSIFLFLLIFGSSQAYNQTWQPVTDNPVELGTVKWSRNYNATLAKANKSNKPVFILFQEVPGCSTCTTYGKEVMSNPLVVEAIETYFEPLCIYNNKKGEDGKVLALYGEPSWNNPVVRVVDENGKNVIGRVSGNYSVGAVTAAIIKTLEKERVEIPEYLKILHEEHTVQKPKETVLGMYCFWAGEKTMAQIPGIVSSEAGFMNGKEVVKVNFDAAIISEEDLVERASAKKCADVVFTDSNYNGSVPKKAQGKFRIDPETKYYLHNSRYKSLPLTPLQKLKVNYELSQSGDPAYLLSPRQRALL